MKSEEYMRPVLISGIIAGVLSAIPFVNLLNVICCLWILVGGVIGVYMVSKATDRRIEYGEGALIGLFCGLVAAVVFVILNTIFTAIGLNMGMVMLQRLAERFPEFEQFRDIDTAARLGAGVIILSLFTSLLFYGAFGALGGVIGTAIYGKKKETSTAA